MKDGLHHRNDHHKQKQHYKQGIHIDESQCLKNLSNVKLSDGDEGDGQEKHQKGGKEPQHGGKKLCRDEGAGFSRQREHEIPFVSEQVLIKTCDNQNKSHDHESHKSDS